MAFIIQKKKNYYYMDFNLMTVIELRIYKKNYLFSFKHTPTKNQYIPLKCIGIMK